jgi:hypothetical protein
MRGSPVDEAYCIREHSAFATNPGRHAFINYLRIVIAKGDTTAFARTFQRASNEFVVRLRVAEDLVHPVGRKVRDERLHARFIELPAIEVARSFGHLEMDQRP